jgi:hypothetical protein
MSRLAKQPSTVPRIVAVSADIQPTSGTELVPGYASARVGHGSQLDGGQSIADGQVHRSSPFSSGFPHHQHASYVLPDHHRSHRPHHGDGSVAVAIADEPISIRGGSAGSGPRVSPADGAHVLDLRSVLDDRCGVDQPLDLTGGSIGRKRCLQSGDSDDGDDVKTSTQNCAPLDLSVKRPRSSAVSASGYRHHGLAASSSSNLREAIGSHAYQQQQQLLPMRATHQSHGSFQVAPSPVPLVQLQQQTAETRVETVRCDVEQSTAAATYRQQREFSSGRQMSSGAVPVIHRATSSSSSASSSGKSTALGQPYAVGESASSFNYEQAIHTSSLRQSVTGSDGLRDAYYANGGYRQTVAVGGVARLDNVAEHRAGVMTDASAPSARGGQSKSVYHFGQHHPREQPEHHQQQQQQHHHHLSKYSVTSDYASSGERLVGSGRLPQEQHQHANHPQYHKLMQQSGNSAAAFDESRQRSSAASGRICHSSAGSEQRFRTSNNETGTYVTPPPPPPLIRQPSSAATSAVMHTRRPQFPVGNGRIRASNWALPVGVDAAAKYGGDAATIEGMRIVKRMSSVLISSESSVISALAGEAESADGLYFRNNGASVTTSAGIVDNLPTPQRTATIVGGTPQSAAVVGGSSGGYAVESPKLLSAATGIGAGAAARNATIGCPPIAEGGSHVLRSQSDGVAIGDDGSDVRKHPLLQSPDAAVIRTRVVQGDRQNGGCASVGLSTMGETNDCHGAIDTCGDDDLRRRNVVTAASYDHRLASTSTPMSNDQSKATMNIANCVSLTFAEINSSVDQNALQVAPSSAPSRMFERERMGGTSVIGTSSVPVGGLAAAAAASPGSRRTIPVANVHPIMKDSSSELRQPISGHLPSSGAFIEKQEAAESATEKTPAADESLPRVAAGMTHAQGIGKPVLVQLSDANGLSASIKDIPDIPLLLLSGQGSSNCSTSSSASSAAAAAAGTMGGTGSGRLMASSSMTSHHMEYVKFLQQTSASVDDTRSVCGSSGGSSGSGSISYRGRGRHRPYQAHRTPPPSSEVDRKSTSGRGRGDRRALSGVGRRLGIGKRTPSLDQTGAARRRLLTEFEDVDDKVSAKAEVSNDSDATPRRQTHSSARSIGPADRSNVENTVTSEPCSNDSRQLISATDGCSSTTSSACTSSSASSSSKKTPIVYFDEDDSSGATSPDGGSSLDGAKTGRGDVGVRKSGGKTSTADAARAKNRNDCGDKELKTRMAKRKVETNQLQQQASKPRKSKSSGKVNDAKNDTDDKVLDDVDGDRDTDDGDNSSASDEAKVST